jgi:hypothetical protein
MIVYANDSYIKLISNVVQFNEKELTFCSNIKINRLRIVMEILENNKYNLIELNDSKTTVYDLSFRQYIQ